jgi:hypothetical protein
MSVLSLFTLMSAGYAQSPVTIEVLEAEGLDSATLGDQLQALDGLQGCQEAIGSASYSVERAEIQQAAGEAPTLRWLPEPVNPPFATCLGTQLTQELLPTLGGDAYSAQVTFQYGEAPQAGLVGAQGTMVSHPPTEEVASGLTMTFSSVQGASQAAIEALLLEHRMEIAACAREVSGAHRGGPISMNGVWAKKLTSVNMLSYGSGLEEVGSCVEGVILALPVLPLAESPRKGLSFQVKIRFPS